MLNQETKPVSATNSSSTDTLCFDKDDFTKPNFSVDEFLHKNRNAPSLEMLRDHLGLYLKELRSSMIDLINEDYADFISLSSNLVGLDQLIETIEQPLRQFHDEIASIRAIIDENAAEIRTQLESKHKLRVLKRNILSLKKVLETVDKLENLLAHQQVETMRAADLERAALELIQIRFNEKFCAEYLEAEQTQTIRNLEADVHRRLRTFFNEALKMSTSDHLERCLRIYITLDACDVAENVFREDFVSPYMSEVISEHSLQENPQGLAGVYSKILNFISLHMTDLLRLTQYTDKLRGFNFLVQSFWADVEMRLETHMSSIFAPGNSEVFYGKYKCTRDFIGKIEQLLSSEEAIKAFREHKKTKSFQARWNLPVYFQICFQEIAGQYESVLEPLLREDSLDLKPASHLFQLPAFSSASVAVERCWSEGVYLQEVFPKFYKLYVQIIMRLSRWIDDVLLTTTGSAGSHKCPIPPQLNKTSLLIAMHTDTQRFSRLLMSQQKEMVLKSLPPMQQQESQLVNETLEKSFKDLHETLLRHLRTIQDTLVDSLIVECGAENIRQVSDLPRLYRKTNREVPTRCSAYVEQMLRPLKTFAEQQKSQLGKDIVTQVMTQVFSKLTNDYYTAVSDVLTSVQRTEESLRRLRNLKSGTPAAASTAAVSTTSDDDKIRLQLRVDVTTWTTELGKLDFTPEQIDKLVELNTIVDESLKVRDTSGNP